MSTTAWVDGQLQSDVIDDGTPLSGDAVAYVVDGGHISSQAMRVQSVKPTAFSGARTE